MLVQCSSCAAKFNIPDAKIAGKRARMKCRKCGTAIPIDGTKLPTESAEKNSAPAPKSSRPKNEPTPKAAADISTRWRVSEPSGARHELSLAELSRRYSQNQLEAGTLVCAPGQSEWMPPYDFEEITAMARGGLPREPQPTFSDETVALGVAESAALSSQARASSSPINTPVPPGSDPSDFFDAGDVHDAMGAFDNITGDGPGPSSHPAQPKPTPSAPKSAGPQAPTHSGSPPTPRSSRLSVAAPKPRSIAPPRPRSSRAPFNHPKSKKSLRSSGPPAAPSSRSPDIPRAISLPRSKAVQSSPPAPPFSTAPPRAPSPPTRSPSISPAAGTSSFPAARSTSSAPTAPDVPTSAGTSSIPSNPSVATARSPSSVPTAPGVPTALASAGGSAHPSQPLNAFHTHIAPHAAQKPDAALPTNPLLHGAPSSPALATNDATLSRTQPPASHSSRPQAPQKGGSVGFVLLLVLILLAGVFGGIYLFRPALFHRGMSEVRQLVGLPDPTKASGQPADGPPFDEPAVGVILGRAAESASQCKELNGPIGKGRAQVLYEPSGKATAVAVSKPFHETTVGRCLIGLFQKTEVPAFGGGPVKVNKTFEVR